MKKIVAIVFGLCVCVFSATGAFAYEDGSLETQTTFYLYDDDPYDLTIDPGRLYQIDRWRLYTNLSNYEDSSGYYMIGTSGELGPGSMAFIFETNTYLNESDRDYWEYDSSQRVDPTELTDTVYTGTEDYIDDEEWSYSYKDETTSRNIYLAYSMDFGIFSIGAGLNPQTEEDTQTIYDSYSFSYSSSFFGSYDFDSSFSNSRDFSYMGIFNTGSNYSNTETETTYGDAAHTKYKNETDATSFTGNSDIDTNNNMLRLSSDIRPSSSLDVQVTLDFTNVDIEEDGTATKSYSYLSDEVGDSDPTADEWWTDGLVNGRTSSTEWTSTWNGSLLGLSRDGSEMGLLIDPTLTVNSNLAVTFLVGYESGSGDLEGGATQTVSYTRTSRNDDEAYTQTWTGSESYVYTYSGDWDSSEISISPIAYLTYGPVEFSLGVGYASGEEENTYQYLMNGTASYLYNDGDAEATDPDDYSATASYTGVQNYNTKTTYTEINFPVGTRFQMTDKLTLRAGAIFSRETTEYESDLSLNEYVNESFSIVYADGTTDNYGPETQIINTEDSAYDADIDREGNSTSTKITTDTTSYRLGLGYQATENLNFDFMFTGTSGGGVSTDVVYVSAVFAF